MRLMMEAYDVVSDLRVWIAGALALSLLLDTVDLPSSELIVVALMVQMALSMDGLKLSKDDISEHRHGILLSVLLCYVVNTLVTLAVGALFIPDHAAMWHGWVLLASMPCAISVVTAAVLMKGSVNVAVVAVASTYVAGIALAPLISFALLGDAVDPLEILKYIVLFIVVPAVVTVPLRRLRLSARLKVPVIDLMMAVMLFLSVNANRGYLISYPDMFLLVVVAVLARLAALILVSRTILKKTGADKRSAPVYHVLCVWKNTGLSVSMCMILLSGTPESVIPCFVCMMVESLWFSIYTKKPVERARRSLEEMLLALFGDVQDDLRYLPRLVLREADLLAQLVVPPDDLALLLLVPVPLRGSSLRLGQLVGDLHAGGDEVYDLLVYGLDLVPKLVGLGRFRHKTHVAHCYAT